MEEFSVVIMNRFQSNWFEKTKGRHVTYNTRQSVLRRKRIYASFVKSKIPKIFTAMPYGWNDNIKGVRNLSSPGCNEINVMSLFNTIPRTKRCHGIKEFNILMLIQDNLYLGEKGSTPLLSSPKSLRSLR
jgi:hypothetical protein